METREVPKEWFGHVKAARKARDATEKQLLHKPGIVRVGIGRDDTATGNLLNKVIEVGITGSKTEHYIPERVNGIPVKIYKHEQGREFHGCYTTEYSVAKAGVSVGGTVCAGSAFARATKNGTEYLLTARHLFNANCSACTDGSTSHEGETATQPEAGDRWGTVKHGSVEHDMVAIKPDFDEDVNNEIISESAPIKGWVTESGYDTYESNGTILDGRADELCTEQFTVLSHNNSHGCSSSYVTLTEQVQLDKTITHGDSGGIAYRVNDNGNAFVGNILTATDANGYTYGAAAYAMNNLNGYSFG